MNNKPLDPMLNLYNPATQSAEQLLAEFIDRKGLLERILDIIRHNTPDRPQQHVILIGPRGMGKTTLLCAIQHRVHGDSTLNAEWLPLLFHEEQYGIGDMADFWLEAIRHLEAALGRSPQIAERLLDEESGDLAEKAQTEFFRVLDETSKRALLLVDNLNDIFAAIDDGEALNRLRALWMTDPRITVIGAAPSYFEEITAVDQAFHDFFRIFALDRLTQEELEAFLRRFAEILSDNAVIRVIEQAPERVAALRILTGGNPRLVKLGYRVLRDGLDGDVRRDLERLLDESTPFFKHRIDSLAKEARRTFDAIARRWDPVTVDDIRKELRKPSNYVSAQIKRLIDEGFVEEAGGSEKKKRYQVSERFYNVYYLMRHSREGRRRLRWLVGFMQTFYTKHDFKEWAKRLENELASPLPEPERTEKLAHLHALSAAADGDGRAAAFDVLVRDAIARNDRRALDEEITDGDPVETHGWRYLVMEVLWLLEPAQRRYLGFRPDDYNWRQKLQEALTETNLMAQAETRINELSSRITTSSHHANAVGLTFYQLSTRWKDAEAAFRKSIELDPQSVLGWNSLGKALNSQRRYNEAEAAFRKAIELDPQSISAWNGLGNALYGQHRYDEAEDACRQLLKLDSQSVFAWNNLGNTIYVQHRYDEAEAAFLNSIEVDPQSVLGWNGLGNTLNSQRRYSEAEAAFRKAIELDPQSISAWNGLGNTLYGQHRYDEAEDACRQLLELDSQSVFAWNNLGNTIYFQQRYDEAATVFRKAIELNPQYVEAWNNLGGALNAQHHCDEAEAAFHKAIELDPKSTYAWNGLGNAFYEQHRYDEAEVAYREAIKFDPQSTFAWNGLGVTLYGQRRYDEAEAAFLKTIEINPQHAYAWINLGGTYLLGLKRIETGVTALLKGLSLAPESSYGRYVLGQCWQVTITAAAQQIAANEPGADNLRIALTEVLLEQTASGERNAIRDALLALDETAQQPFEPLLLALQAFDDRTVLYRIASEKRDLVLDVMQRISSGDS